MDWYATMLELEAWENVADHAKNNFEAHSWVI